MGLVALSKRAVTVVKSLQALSMRVLSKQWQGEFCRCSINVVGGKQRDGGIDHLERFRHHTGPSVARQSKHLVQRQSGLHPMVEQRSAGKLVSSPKPPAA